MCIYVCVYVCVCVCVCVCVYNIFYKFLKEFLIKKIFWNQNCDSAFQKYWKYIGIIIFCINIIFKKEIPKREKGSHGSHVFSIDPSMTNLYKILT